MCTKLHQEISSINQQAEMILARSEERIKARKGRFNLFTTLLQAHDETRLHSRFLHFLLNPHESHDCGDLFLRAFTEVLPKERLPQSELFSSDHFKFGCTEKQTNTGRFIDIYLEFVSGKIAIENKIWAGEEDNQIQDYADFINSSEANNLLIYLTLHGVESETAGKGTYLPISYEKHILDWIEKCLSRTYEFININIALQQYRNVIQGLLGMSNQKEDIDQIKKCISQESTFLSNFEIIKQSVDGLYNDVWRDLLGELKQSLVGRDNGMKCVGCSIGQENDPRSHNGDTFIQFYSKTGNEFHIGTCMSAKPYRMALTICPDTLEPSPGSPNREQANTIYSTLKDEAKFKQSISQGYWGVFYYLESCPESLDDPKVIQSLLNKDKRNVMVEEAVKEVEDFMKLADESLLG